MPSNDDRDNDLESVLKGLEAALVRAATKHFGEQAQVAIQISRQDGSISAAMDGIAFDLDQIVGPIGAKTAAEVASQKIREAERDRIVKENQGRISKTITGVVERWEGGAVFVRLGSVEAIIPRSEQAAGEAWQPGQHIEATVLEVRKVGSRAKIILSRARPITA